MEWAPVTSVYETYDEPGHTFSDHKKWGARQMGPCYSEVKIICNAPDWLDGSYLDAMLDQAVRDMKRAIALHRDSGPAALGKVGP